MHLSVPQFPYLSIREKSSPNILGLNEIVHVKRLAQSLTQDQHPEKVTIRGWLVLAGGSRRGRRGELGVREGCWRFGGV